MNTLPGAEVRLASLRFFRAFSKANTRVHLVKMGYIPKLVNCVVLCTVLLPLGGNPVAVKCIIRGEIPVVTHTSDDKTIIR